MSFVPQTSSYTGTNVVNEVRRELGDQAGVLFSNDDALFWVNAGQREVAVDLELFGSATVDIVADQANYTIPVEISKRIRDLQVLLVDGVRLEALTYLEAQSRWMQPVGSPFPDPGTPRWWYQRNQTITLVPTPDTSSADGLTVQFDRTPVDLTALGDTLDIPDSHYNALVAYVRYRAYLVTQEGELANLSMAEMERGIRKSLQRERRSQTNTHFALTPNEDDY